MRSRAGNGFQIYQTKMAFKLAGKPRGTQHAVSVDCVELLLGTAQASFGSRSHHDGVLRARRSKCFFFFSRTKTQLIEVSPSKSCPFFFLIQLAPQAEPDHLTRRKILATTSDSLSLSHHECCVHSQT